MLAAAPPPSTVDQAIAYGCARTLVADTARRTQTSADRIACIAAYRQTSVAGATAHSVTPDFDTVRFGESSGYEYNQPRENAWRYRDWVIGALNEDLPYDQFARMQIAGDLARPNTMEGAAAVGFLVAGTHNTVLGASPAMKPWARPRLTGRSTM